MTVGVWFRRDLRLSDSKAINEAARASPDVLGVFVFDPAILSTIRNPLRLGYLKGALASLDHSMDGRLNLAVGDPAVELPALSRRLGISQWFYTQDFSALAQKREREVAVALSRIGVRAVPCGFPSVVSPLEVVKNDGSPYARFSAYYRSWRAHTRETLPIITRSPIWRFDAKCELPPAFGGVLGAFAGEGEALSQWGRFRESSLASYGEHRNLPAIEGTSRLSSALHFGCLHPRTLLAALSERDEVFRSELCWREFYGEMLFRFPFSSRQNLNDEFDSMRWDEGALAEERFQAWKAGRTGHPMVDAGMRQLSQEGWMHNRLRMITASFLVKDLHIHWKRGARYFLDTLIDADVASNSHGWQWVAGTGIDASPYYRIFNPILQGRRFDPEATFIRRYLPELSVLTNAVVHTPWEDRSGSVLGLDDYPPRIIDHDEERREALRRYEEVRVHSSRSLRPRR